MIDDLKKKMLPPFSLPQHFPSGRPSSYVCKSTSLIYCFRGLVHVQIIFGKNGTIVTFGGGGMGDGVLSGSTSGGGGGGGLLRCLKNKLCFYKYTVLYKGELWQHVYPLQLTTLFKRIAISHDSHIESCSMLLSCHCDVWVGGRGVAVLCDSTSGVGEFNAIIMALSESNKKIPVAFFQQLHSEDEGESCSSSPLECSQMKSSFTTEVVANHSTTHIPIRNYAPILKKAQSY